MPVTDPSNPNTQTFSVVEACLSDLGMRRENNQDSLAVDLATQAQWLEQGHFFMVADGMGAHAAGELASKLAADNVPHTYRKLRTLSPPEALRQAIQQANETIHEKGQSASEFNGMGTTCSCLVLLPGAALLGHVGDSRVYRLRCDQFEQLTFDHSLVWEMAQASQTPDDEVPSCIPKNVITRSLGPHAKVNVDLEGPFDVLPRDKYLICSDGLTTVVDDDLIGSLAACLPAKELVQTLVDIANLRGGPDNISIVVAEVPGEKAPCSDNGHAAAGPSEHSQGFFAKLFGWAFSNKVSGRRQQSATAGEMGGPYGNGPYRQYACNARVAASDLDGLCRQLMPLESDKQSPLTHRKNIDWNSFRTQCTEATNHLASDLPEAAVEAFAGAIRQLMAQVRSSPTDDDSHSKRIF